MNIYTKETGQFMLIEAASTRLAIDLLESLRKFKLNASEIRVSFKDKRGSTTFTTYNSIDDIKALYTDRYNRLINGRRDPFTKDRRKAQLTPTVINGLIVSGTSVPVNDSGIPGFCELGKFVTIESFKLDSTTFNYGAGFICKDISTNTTVRETRQVDLRKNSTRSIDVARHQTTTESFIEDYKTILNRLFRAYNANLYVDLCYVQIGYVLESILLYNIFFALVKDRLDTGLRLSVLEPRLLKKIPL